MKKNLQRIFSTLLFLFITTVSSASVGRIIIAAGTGDWKSTSTWTGGVIPATGDVAIIPTNITVNYQVTFNSNGGGEDWLNPTIYVYGTLEFTSSSVSQFVATQFDNPANVYVFSGGTFFDNQYSNGFYLNAIMNIYMYSGANYSISSGQGFPTSEFSVSHLNNADDFNPSIPGTVSSPGPNSANNPYNLITHNTTAPPVVAPLLATTGNSSNINLSTATLGGSVYSTSVATTVTFDYGTDPTLTTYLSASAGTVDPNVQNATISANLTNLSSGTKYYYRIRGTNSAGASFGKMQSFTTELSSDATLSALSLSAGSLTPSFSGTIVSYTAQEVNATASITITPTKNQANASVKVNGSTVNSGSASNNINLNIGDNIESIVVTAQDGTTTKTYTVTVNRPKAAQTITFNALPTKTYGDADFAPGATASSGLAASYSSDNLNVATIVSGQLHIIGAGTANITASQGGDANTTAATNVVQALAVNKDAIIVTANSGQGKTYGDSDPLLTYSISPGLVSGDNFTGSLARDAGEGAGTYAIQQGTLSLGGNYSITFNSAPFQIDPKTINVTANAKTKTAGEADPVFDYTADALAGSDSFSGALGRTAGETAGDYAINIGTLMAGANYAINFTSANLTIVAAPVTLTSISTVTTSPTNAATVNYTVKFAGAITGLSASNLTLTTTGLIGASITGVADNGDNTYTVAVNTGAGSGTLILNLDNASGLSTGISNTLPFAGDVYSINKPDQLSIKSFSTIGNVANPGNLTYVIGFDNPATGLSAANFSVNTQGPQGAGVTSVTDNHDNTYNVNVNSGSGLGRIALSITNDNNLVGTHIITPLPQSTGYYNLLAPTTISGVVIPKFAYPGTTVNISFSVNTYIPFATVTIGDATLRSNFGGTNFSFSYTFTGDNFGPFYPVINAYGGAGGSATYTSPRPITYAAVPTTITSIAAASTNPVNSSSVNYTVTFTDAVTGLAVNNFALTTTGSVTGAVINSVTDNGDKTYTVNVTPGTGSGTLTLNLVNENNLSTGISNSLPFKGGTYGINGPVKTFSYGTAQNLTINSPITPIVPTLDGGPAYTFGTAANYKYTYNVPKAILIGIDGKPILLTNSGSILTYQGNIIPEPVDLSPYTATAFTQDAAGNIYFLDSGNGVAAKIPADGSALVTIVSGLSSPAGITMNGDGYLYISCKGIGSVQKVAVDGSTNTTYVSGLTSPGYITIDALGNIFVSQSTGKIAKIPSGGGTKTDLNQTNLAPISMAADPAGNLYVVTETDYTLKFFPANKNLAITMRPATFQNPVTTDSDGNLFIGDPSTVISKTTLPGIYTVSPALPDGLALDQLTGNISGTPTTLTTPTDYTINYYSSQGSNSTTVRLGVATDSNLNNLTLSAGTLSPAFDSATLSYTASVASNVNTITITPTADDPTKVITINHKAVTSGSGALKTLVVGDNLFTIVVTNSSNVKKSYTLTINRGIPGNANLSSLTMNPTSVIVNDGNVGNTYNRHASVDPGISSVTIKPTASDPGAVITVNGTVVASGAISPGIPLVAHSTLINVVITGADGITVKTYALTVVKNGSADASLSSLAMSPTAVLVAGITVGSVYNRTTSVSPNATTISLKPTASEPHATIKINGTSVASGTELTGISLNSDGSPTTVNVVVTAQDGVTTRTYAIVVSKNGSSDASLAKLAISPASPIISTGNAAPFYYRSATISVDTRSISVIATANDAGATIKVNDVTAASGVATGPIITNFGNTLVNIVVTAGDGVTTKTYALTVNRQGFGTFALHTPSDVITFAPQPKPANPYGDVFVHRTVSPTGDGINDFLKIDGIEAYKDNNLTIVNQSGKRVFQIAGYDNAVKVFNGRSSQGNASLPSGTYFYVLNYKAGSEVKNKSGYFVLKN